MAVLTRDWKNIVPSFRGISERAATRYARLPGQLKRAPHNTARPGLSKGRRYFISGLPISNCRFVIGGRR
jgi:hypothetical protein